MVPEQVRFNGQSDYDRVANRALEPGRLARLLAHARPGSLDKALIEGCDPAGSPQLAARAATLTDRRSRRAIADGLERLLRSAEGHPRPTGVLRGGGHVLANGPVLRELASALRGSAPLYARGIALVNQLLTDGAGPAYQGDSRRLARRLDEARAAIGGA
jgi:hypothetical protein